MNKIIALIVFAFLSIGSAQAQVWTAESTDWYSLPASQNNQQNPTESLSDWDMYKTRPTQYNYTYTDDYEKGYSVPSNMEIYKRSQQPSR